MEISLTDENFNSISDSRDANSGLKGMSKKKKNTIMKFITVGLMGVALAGAVSQVVSNISPLVEGYKKYTVEQSQRTELFEMADSLKKVGFDGFSLKVKASSSLDIMNSFALKNFTDNTCTVNLFVNSKAMENNKKFESAPLEKLSDLVLIASHSSNNEKSIQRFALYHELGHCDELNNPGLYDFGGDFGRLFAKVEDGNSYAENFIKNYLGGERITDSLGLIVSESYAESVAQILAARDDLGGNMDATLMKRELSSYFNRSYANDNSKGSQTYSHDFYYLSTYAKTSEFKERVAGLSSVEDIRSYANELSQKNLKQVLASKDISTLYDAQVLKREVIMNYRAEVQSQISPGSLKPNAVWKELVQELKSNLTEEQQQRFKDAVLLELKNPNIDNLSREEHASVAGIYHEIYKASPDFQNVQIFKDLKAGISQWVAGVEPIAGMKTNLTRENFKDDAVIAKILETRYSMNGNNIKFNKEAVNSMREEIQRVSSVKNKISPS